MIMTAIGPLDYMSRVRKLVQTMVQLHRTVFVHAVPSACDSNTSGPFVIDIVDDTPRTEISPAETSDGLCSALGFALRPPGTDASLVVERFRWGHRIKGARTGLEEVWLPCQICGREHIP